MQEEQHTGLENNAHYLHFRYRYRFLANFKDIYNAYLGKHRENETKPTFDKTEAFFQSFVALMGLEHEFEMRTIDPRTFTLRIRSSKITDEVIHECISAGQLMSIAPMLVDIIAKPKFQRVALILGDTTYVLEQRDE